MPSGDSDHNYYTLHHHRPHSQQADYRRPSRHSLDSDEDNQYRPPPTSSKNPAPSASTFPDPQAAQQSSPRLPAITTSFEKFASNARLNGVANGALAEDDSPDPHEFYRQFQDPFGRPASGHPDQPDIVVERVDGGMARPAYQQKSSTSTARSNGITSKHAPISPRDGTRLSYRSASGPAEATSSLNVARSNPNLSSASRSQQSSLKELVNRFNQNRDDNLPLPAQKATLGARPGGSTAAESSRSGGARKPTGWKPAGKGGSSGATRDMELNDRHPHKAPKATQRSRYTREDNASTTPAPRSPKSERSKPPPLSPIVHYASRSMTHLPQTEEKTPRRPLFGEILTVVSGSGGLGYGISGYQRRGSDGNMPNSDPAFHKRSRSDVEISPSSPTAWYLGLTPSLDGIDISKRETPSGHRRAKSDAAGLPSNLPSTASGLGVHMKTVSPSPELSPTAGSHGAATRNQHQHSRIPLSTRRLSDPSDSGSSPPATRTSFNAGGRVTTPPKGQSAIPKPHRRSISPSGNPPVGSPRGSSRQQVINAGLPSPSLKAYISAPAPKVSPPLRSSRPRQPISSANATSRGRYADRHVVVTNKTGPPSRDNRPPNETRPRTRRIPELGGVDFAARREKIQKAFTKSLEESQRKDADEAVKKRLAKENEGEGPQKEEDVEREKGKEIEKATAEEWEDGRDGERREERGANIGIGGVGESDQERKPEGEPEAKGDVKDEVEADEGCKPVGESDLQSSHDLGTGQTTTREDEKRLSLDMTVIPLPSENGRLNQMEAFRDDDSPTLSTPTDDGGRRAPGPPDRTPLSATSAAAAGGSDYPTSIENSPQQEHAHIGRLANPNAPRQRTVLSQVMQMREASPPRTEIADDTTSENGSIQIMLRDTPIVDSFGFQDPNNFPWDMDFGRTTTRRSRDSLGSTSHSGEPLEKEPELSMEPVGDPPQIAQADGVYTSIPRIVTDQSSAQDWSPVSPPTTTTRSGRTTLDTEAYNAISRVLEHYHDPNFVSPEIIHDFQQQIFTQSPELARQGGWDPKRVTQLYLQELARTRVTNHRPGLGIPRLELTVDHTDQHPDRESDEDAVTPATTTDIEYTDIDDSTGGAQQESASETGWSSTGPKFDAGLDAGLNAGLNAGLRAKDEPEWRLSSASLQNREDWTDASPSVADWIAPLAAIDGNDDRDFPPTPPPKDWEASQKPPIPAKIPLQSNRQDPSREGAETPRLATDERPQLPELDSIGEGLGLAIDVGPLDRPPAVPPPPVPNYSPPPPPTATLDQPVRPATAHGYGVFSPPSPSVYTKHPPSSVFQDESSRRDSSTRKSDDNSFLYTGSAYSTMPTSFAESQENITQCQQTVELSIKPPTPTLEQRRLSKRKHVLKELVDTESSFLRDMTVTEEIYKGTSNACAGVTAEDVKVLFGNSDQIVAFSKSFLDALKQAVSFVYILPKSSTGSPSKRGSVSSSGSPSTEDRSSLSGPDLTDDEKDRRTFVGEVFGQHMSQMEKVYGDYLKNHDAANKRLQKLQANKNVALWLQECRTVAEDLTHAWSLDSLLVKPVQRVLKYPLLLAQLLEETPDDHPDFSAIEVAAREMTEVSHRINELKKRVDLVEKAIGRKRKESDVRAGISKAFGRRTEKLRQQVGLSGAKEDRVYDELSTKFGTHFFQLQVVMRDVEMYTTDITEFVDKFNAYIQAVEEFIDVSQTNFTEAESKWRKFAMSVREMGARALSEHKAMVRKSVIEPMTTLLKLHDGPQKLMGKRNKRVIDYARYTSVKDRGEKPDKRTQEQAEQFMALNDTLKEELPRLFSLTAKLVGVCLENFVELQVQWQTIWQEKLKCILDEQRVPKDISEVVEQFSGDFTFTENQVSGLGICNGSILADRFSLLSHQTTKSLDSTSSSRHLPNLDSRSRGFSLSSEISPCIPAPDFENRHSGSFSFSPIAEQAPELLGAAAAPARLRANSTSSRPSPTPDLPSGPSGGRSYSAVTPPTTATRPSTARSATDLPVGSRPPSGSTYFSASQEPHRLGNSPRPQSNIFSSAMPMPDSKENSPDPSRPVSPHDITVLFLAASLFEFNIDKARKEAGYPYLTYVPGEIFDVIGEKGELWLARNQDDPTEQVGWIWSRHFARLADDT
ncbi:hypothetical protein GP486_006024 [Trichoglossum hirsutum]|uniref:Dynamin-binding protein n=1 Tax=Trichoglossum hirsutum TaxID=265104 RepID=A0A9P8L846_9PEZI|nr:hypothetical protein GP486_006024 [Trichoglossum hirsutum]